LLHLAGVLYTQGFAVTIFDPRTLGSRGTPGVLVRDSPVDIATTGRIIDIILAMEASTTVNAGAGVVTLGESCLFIEANLPTVHRVARMLANNAKMDQTRDIKFYMKK
jgi:hypothetical protein